MITKASYLLEPHNRGVEDGTAGNALTLHTADWRFDPNAALAYLGMLLRIRVSAECLKLKM